MYYLKTDDTFLHNCHGQTVLGSDLPTTNIETPVITNHWTEFLINGHAVQRHNKW